MDARYDPDLTAFTRLIYADLLGRCHYGRRATKITDQELADLYSVTVKTINRSINALYDKGYISKIKKANKRKINVIRSGNRPAAK